MFIAVGDDEYKNPNPPTTSTTSTSRRTSSSIGRARAEPDGRAPRAERRARLGRWGAGFVEGAKYAFQFVARPEVSVMKATLVGTAGEEREGGVAVDAAGNVYEALAAEGSVDGQSYAAAKGRRPGQVRARPGRSSGRREFGTAGIDRAYGLRARPAGAPGGHRLHEGRPRRSARGDTSDDLFVAEVRPERHPRVGDGRSASRPSPIAGTASRSTATAPSTRPATRRARSAGRIVGDKDVVCREARRLRHAAVAAAVRRGRRGQGAWRSPQAAAASSSPA